MTESPLKIAISWQKLFSDAKTLVDSKLYERAIEVLTDALNKTQCLDPEDLRVAETLERLAFSYHSLGLLQEAEPHYRRALEIASLKMLSLRTKQACAENLGRLLLETGRGAEAEALLNKYPKPAVVKGNASRPTNSLENSIMLSLSILSRTEDKSIISIMEDLLAYIETVYGADSLETANALDFVGRALSQVDAHAASEYHKKSLLLKQEKLDDGDGELASSMRALAAFQPDSDLSKALISKARAIEKAIGLTNSVDKTISLLLSIEGQSPPPDMPVAQAEEILDQWRRDQTTTARPYVDLKLTPEQKYKQLVSLLDRALAVAEAVEAEASHPLCTICLLADASRWHKQFGAIKQAKALRERQMSMIAKHWGEGHAMMVEAVEEFDSLNDQP